MTDTASNTERNAGPGPWVWPLVICLYFAFQVAWRRLLGGGLGLDEAQMLLWSQQLAWGYGPQPPLYSWLQWGVLGLVGDPLLALAILKNILLAGFYLAVWRLLRSAHPPDVAGLATLGLFLVPQIAWDCQRDMTHSVLVLTMATLTTLAFWTRTLQGRRGGWALFGLLVGLGMLSKVNFALVPASLLGAALLTPGLRTRLAARGLLIAAGIAALIIAPPYGWAVLHPDLALSSAGELKRAAWSPAIAGRGLIELGKDLLGCLALAGLILGLIRWRRAAPPMADAVAGTLEGFLLRVLLIGVGLTALGIAATGTTHVRDIWLLPVIYLGAPLLALVALRRIGPAGRRILVRVIAGLACLVAVALAVHIRYGDPGHPALRRAPVADLAAAALARHPAPTRIIAAPDWLAGSLIYWRPDLPVASPQRPGPPPDAAAGPVLLLTWREKPGSVEHIAARLSALWESTVTPGASEPLEAPFPPQPKVSFGIEVTPLAVTRP
ncbi:MAG: glycosyltransferase family 39 protein [Rhodobacteraceae bacterium]|nr:glycosyltransferase family 39 protein [Paracoccaceae bacterium]